MENYRKRTLRLEDVQATALGLVRELNRADLPPHLKAQVIRLVGNINEAQRSGDPSQLRQANAQIHAHLRDGPFALTPCLVFDSEKKELVGDWHAEITGGYGGMFEAWAPQMSLCILRVAAAGVLWSVRRCLQCKEWYLARRRTQRFCRFTCRQKTYVQSPHGKKRNAQYMRKYRVRRARLKLGKVLTKLPRQFSYAELMGVEDDYKRVLREAVKHGLVNKLANGLYRKGVELSAAAQRPQKKSKGRNRRTQLESG